MKRLLEGKFSTVLFALLLAVFIAPMAMARGGGGGGGHSSGGGHSFSGGFSSHSSFSSSPSRSSFSSAPSRSFGSFHSAAAVATVATVAAAPHVAPAAPRSALSTDLSQHAAQRQTMGAINASTTARAGTPMTTSSPAAVAPSTGYASHPYASQPVIINNGGGGGGFFSSFLGSAAGNMMFSHHDVGQAPAQSVGANQSQPAQQESTPSNNAWFWDVVSFFSIFASLFVIYRWYKSAKAGRPGYRL